VKTFFLKLINLMAIGGVLCGYNLVMEIRAQEDTVARMQAQVQTMQTAEAGSAAGTYTDGVYTGEAEGFGGTISVEVTVENGAVTGIEILSAEKEDNAYLTMAKDIIPAILEQQSAEVDTISGATFSSTGIKNAVAEALQKAG